MCFYLLVLMHTSLLVARPRNPKISFEMQHDIFEDCRFRERFPCSKKTIKTMAACFVMASYLMKEDDISSDLNFPFVYLLFCLT